MKQLSPFPILTLARESAPHELPYSVQHAAVTSTCSVCGKHIEANADVMRYASSSQPLDSIAHKQCADAHFAALVKMAGRFSFRSLKAVGR